MTIKRWVRYQYLKLVRIDDTPSRIAMGMAVGVFLGIFPTFGFGTILAFILAVLFRFNKAAAVIGSFIMNPLTTPLFWSGSAVLGTMLVGGDWHRVVQAIEAFSKNFTFHTFLTRDLWRILFGAAKKSLYIYFIGNLIISLFFAVLAYFLTFKLTIAYRQRKAAWFNRKDRDQGSG